MPDREKVIKAYEDFVNGYECFCTSDDYEYEMHKAVLALLKEQTEREKAICKEICDFIRGACSTDTDDDKDFVCYEIQKCFTQCGRSVK